MELSHRMALLGERGASGLHSEVRAFFSEGQWEKEMNTLRLTLATLLAGLVGYHGPVIKAFHPIRTMSQTYDPWLGHDDNEEHTHERTMQAEEARTRFVAGDPEAYPW